MISQLFPRVLLDWDTEPAAPQRRAPAALDLREVKVAAVKDEGFKTADGGWLNWSRFREPSAFIMPRVGDVARVGLDSKGFIRQLAIVGPEASPAPRPIAGGAPALAPATLQALAATRKPEPPSFEAEPDWLNGQAAAPAPLAPVRIEQNLRETVITRLACLKAAAEASAGLATEDILAQAEAFETWCIR